MSKKASPRRPGTGHKFVVKRRPAIKTVSHIASASRRRSTGGHEVPDRWHGAVWGKVCEIPMGSVSTYGDIATALGTPGYSRHVGRALSALPHGCVKGLGHVPWWRVVNCTGSISFRDCDRVKQGSGSRQRNKLEAEGFEFASRRGSASIKNFHIARWRFMIVSGDAEA